MLADGVRECTCSSPEQKDQSSSDKSVSGFKSQICYSP